MSLITPYCLQGNAGIQGIPMLAIAPGTDLLKRAVIAGGLSSVCSNNNIDNIILDFSVPQTGIYWTMYKSNIKYVEDILPVLSSINSKMLKNFLSPIGANLVLGLKSKRADEINFDRLSYLIDVLAGSYKQIFLIMPDDNSPASFDLLKKSKAVLLPFMSDLMSARNAVYLSETYISKLNSIDIIPLQLDLGFDFHTDKVFAGRQTFQSIISVDFSDAVSKQLFSENSYRNAPKSFTQGLEKILNSFEEKEISQAQIDESADTYFKDEETYRDLANKIYVLLVEAMKNYTDETDTLVLKQTATAKIEEILKRLDLKLPKKISDRLFKELRDNVAGLGILEDLIDDPQVTEIMVNGPDSIYMEKAGKLSRSELVFPDERRLLTVIDRIVAQIGRHIDEASPIVDARLKDGSRVNAVIRPIALNGATLTIRKFLKNIHSADKLVDIGTMSNPMVEFLKTAVKLRKNIIISGGTGTGKTTLLNTVSSFIPETERLITIEDSAELQLQQHHVIRLEARPKSTEGTGEISIRRLVVNSLRMRPDRIIVGECRSGEALDMLQAMNTGHEGSMTTVHANSEKDAFSRLVTMVLMSGAELPEKSIVSQIASAIHVIVQLTRYFDGTRKVSSISVVNNGDSEGDYEVKKVFQFELGGIENGRQLGQFKSAGYIPAFIKTASTRGINVDMEIFK
ncbi:MAG: CpaF family protein [Endomicrobium sp.]|jgi:pilus assembly protein CpaF|nr:CpaF family protein [Endomicrobium sp.]